MNQDSSRSHSVFTITVEVAEPQENGEVGNAAVIVAGRDGWVGWGCARLE